MACWTCCLLTATVAAATDFRIASQVFVGDGKQAASTNITLFRAGIVYDYLSEPESVTIFDPLRGRFVLIDPVEQIQCEVATKEVAAFNDELRLRAAGSQDPLLQFMANPQFKVITPQPGVLHLTGPHMNYRIQVQRVGDKGAVRQYVEFSDWYARLNTLMNPGSPPPFTRISMNQILLERGEVPKEVMLTVRPAQHVPNAREVQLRSTHDVSWKLLADDLRRIDSTGEQLATFQQVSMDDFINAGQREPAKPGMAQRPPARPPSGSASTKLR
jgi:hypothetical protein